VTVEERFQKSRNCYERSGAVGSQRAADCRSYDEALDRIERDIQILIEMRRPKNGKTKGNA